MSKIYPASADFVANARKDEGAYRAEYAESVNDNAAYWARIGKRLDWIRPYTKIKDVSFAADDLHVRWYEDGQLNVSANCLDRHLATRGDKAAILWEPDDPKQTAQRITYRDLHARVCRFANALRAEGVNAGDRVTIYLPMIPEAAVAMLACARIGAVHSVVFGGFSPESVAGRIADCGSKLVITADEGLRGGKHVPLKANVDEALEHAGTECVERVIMVSHTGSKVGWNLQRDRRYEDLVANQPETCEPAVMNAEDPLFILYTSGSTGKPKGVLHTTGGYLVYLSETEVAMRRVRDEAFHQAEDLRRRINDQEAECAKLRQIVEAPAMLEKARGEITRLRRCRGVLHAEREQSSKLLAKLDERIIDLEQRVAEEMQSASDAMAVAEGEFAVSGTLTKLDTELRVTRAACDKVNAKLQNLDEQLRAIPTQLAEAERAFRCAQAAEADIDFNEQVPHLMDVIARASVSAHSINSYGRREDEFTITIPRDYVEAARAKLAAEVPGYAGDA